MSNPSLEHFLFNLMVDHCGLGSIFNLMVERRDELSPAASDDEATLSTVFRALADTSRRRILVLLREAGRLRVTDLAAAFSMSLNGVSKHIKVLEEAGLVVRHVTGRTHWLEVGPRSVDLAHRWLDTHRHFWGERLDALAQHLESTTNEEKDND